MTDGPDTIKSAFEKAMEKIDKLPTPTKEERLKWKGMPEGNRLAAKYLRGEGNLSAAVAQAENDLRPFVLKGILEVLVANIQLPKNEASQASMNKAVEGIRSLFPKKNNVQDLVGRVQYVAEQYRTFGAQQRQQVYDQLKAQFQGQVQEAMRRQGVAREMPSIETLPEFQQEWMRVKSQIDKQYEEHMESFRQQLRALA